MLEVIVVELVNLEAMSTLAQDLCVEVLMSNASDRYSLSGRSASDVLAYSHSVSITIQEDGSIVVDAVQSISVDLLEDLIGGLSFSCRPGLELLNLLWREDLGTQFDGVTINQKGLLDIIALADMTVRVLACLSFISWRPSEARCW